jgi:hypothetical protein
MTHAFIIRLWIETGTIGNPEALWRGSIAHVGTKRRIYFSDLNEAVGFIQEQLGLRLSTPQSWWRVVSGLCCCYKMT